ncbi:MAG: NAD(P)H-quinone oxidoreductase, partial [Saprospiraceae bacterium]|nr:NAD(P)H-quinone oxidoreductase [Saprospiraceae bacterium]
MKAIRVREFGGPEQLYIGDWPDPVPHAREVMVKVEATALNRADILQRKGSYPPPEGESPVMGLEMAGTIVDCGREVHQWKVGDRVCGLLGGGGYAQYVALHEDMVMPIPGKLNFLQAAAIPEVFLTAFQALQWLAELTPGETVLIHAGASGVGTAAIQLAVAMQASALVTASAAKHSICLELGAEAAIDYREEEFDERILSDHRYEGVEVIVDFVGSPYFQKNLRCLSMDGRLVM